MDPKQNTPTLDPKLQEVYDRVMGTTPTPNPGQTIPTPPSPSDPIPATPAVPPIIPTPADTSAAPAALPQTEPTVAQVPVESMQATLNTPLQMSAEKVTIGEGGSPVAEATHPKGKGLSPVVLIFGAIAFLVVYAVFWVRFFGLNLPFLPH